MFLKRKEKGGDRNNGKIEAGKVRGGETRDILGVSRIIEKSTILAKI